MDTTVKQKVDAYFSQYPSKKYRKGEILIRADETPAGIFLLTKGSVKQYAISKEGVEQTLNIFKPGSFFPLIWAINEISNRHYFEAMTEVSVLVAPKENVLSFIQSEPDVLYDLLSRLYRGMNSLLVRIEYLMSGDAYHKVIYTMLNTAFRFGEMGKKENEVILHTTQREIAAFSGLTKETISRELHKLKEKKLIENGKQRIRIKDIHALEEELAR